ncbi:MAG: carboxypeptidase regulatory-like domain-containing protein, partial [Abditibacteriota bacterium]|nr:carboxypeptidase regulatory-like domain-containing protein [Abditibacteriota bacterium]
PIIFAALLAALLIAVPLRADDPLTIPVYFDTTDPTGDSLDYVDVTLDGIRKITYAYAGHFGFEKVRLGKHSVTFEREGYYSKKIDFTLTEEDYLIGGYREAVTLYPNRSTAKIHTRDAVTGDTLDYVDVTVAGQFKNYAYNGDFSFFDVPDGTHIVSAVRPGYYSQTAPITINGGVGEITINLRPDNAKVIINVIDENGDTLDHETVSVAGQSKNYAYNGHFEFSGVPDGTYTATIERDGYYTQTAEITVEGRDTETTVVLYNTASKLTVYTVDENGDNLDYVDVSVAGQFKNYGYPGRFEFTGIPDGTHIVHTERPGYYPCDTEVYISGADKEITVVLYNDNVTFTANVKNAKGETMDYTDVAIAGQSKTYGYPGRFEFSGVPDGTQTLTLNKDGYNPVIYKAAIQGTSQTKDFTLYKPTGTVMGFWYNPQYDVIDLTLEPVRSGTPYYAYGSKSNFVFNNVENGSYRVKVFGYQVGNVVVNGDTVNAESFGGPGIAGYARDCYGNPIEGVTVTCGDATATTDGSGLYMMDKPNGTYTVTFTKSGYTTKSDTAVVDNCYDWLCATLATSETLVYGYITDSKGVAIEGATVTCGSVTATTGKDGAYKMTVPNGSRTITASKAKFYNNSVTLNIPADSEPLFTNISLTTNQGVIYGYVTNPDGAPIEGAAVKIGSNTFATT